MLVRASLLIVASAWVAACAGSLAHLVGNDRAPRIVCQAKVCPTDEQLALALTVAARHLPGFDAGRMLDVEWREWSPTAAARTPSHVVVSAWRQLGHEVRHVHLWRTLGDGDREHQH